MGTKPKQTGLRHGSLGIIETIGQSIANIAPTATPALTVAPLIGLAGTGSWLSFLLATLGMILVASNIAALARRHPSAGSYFVYIGRTLGPLAGLVAGWSMVAAYLGVAVVAVIGGRIVFGNVLDEIGVPDMKPPAWLFDLGFVVVIWALAWRDIRISARVGVIIECLSVGTIIVISAIVLIRTGTALDPVQLDFLHLDRGGIVSALPLAVFCFTGFESAATLAREARDPIRAIPRAIMLSVVVSGLFFVGITYAMVLAVGGEARVLAESAAPFSEITRRAGLASAAAVVYIAALNTSSGALACVNAVSRLMFSMGRYEFIHPSMGRVHDRHHTPHVAITASSLLIAAVCLAMGGVAPLDAYGLTASFSTFGFLVIYLLVSIVAPVDLFRAKLMRRRDLMVGTGGVALMFFVIFGSLYPAPDYPYNVLPYLFAAYLLLGTLWHGVLVTRAPQALTALQADLEL
jgi:amino acid transporter